MAREKEHIRVPGTTTLLVCVLDRILREQLRFVPLKHPGWTFEHGGDYVVPDGGVYHHYRSIYLCGARMEWGAVIAPAARIFQIAAPGDIEGAADAMAR